MSAIFKLGIKLLPFLDFSKKSSSVKSDKVVNVNNPAQVNIRFIPSEEIEKNRCQAYDYAL